MKKWSWVSWTLIFASGVATGLPLWFLIKNQIVFKPEVGVGDFINFFTGVIITLVLQNIIQKRFSNARIEKDLLIARINLVDAALNETHKLFMRKFEDFSSVEPLTMHGAYRQLTNSLFMFEKALNSCQSRMSDLNIDKVKETRVEYRKELLGGNFPNAPYDEQALIKAERHYREMSLELQALIFEINRK